MADLSNEDNMDIDEKASVLASLPPQYTIIDAMMTELVSQIREPSVSGLMSGPTMVIYDFLGILHELVFGSFKSLKINPSLNHLKLFIHNSLCTSAPVNEYV